jgi:UDP-glucose 6-dehydrogenase
LHILFIKTAKENDVDYETLRELFILDPRVNPSHTFVYDDHPYWSSHCLNKDVPTIAKWADAKLLQAIIEFNENQKKPK